MYQVTALYQDVEVGHGESDVYQIAMNDAAGSVSTIYPASDVTLVCTSNIGELPVTVRTPLDTWLAFFPA